MPVMSSWLRATSSSAAQARRGMSPRHGTETPQRRCPAQLVQEMVAALATYSGKMARPLQEGYKRQRIHEKAADIDTAQDLRSHVRGAAFRAAHGLAGISGLAAHTQPENIEFSGAFILSD